MAVLYLRTMPSGSAPPTAAPRKGTLRTAIRAASRRCLRSPIPASDELYLRVFLVLFRCPQPVFKSLQTVHGALTATTWAGSARGNLAALTATFPPSPAAITGRGRSRK